MIDPIGFTEPLLAWYHDNRRVLPWREHPDPYRVWVSEIMLQQTQIDTVIPYFERFIAHLPTVADLAAVADEVLYKLWEGLGYYRRAANLKKAARTILDLHAGQIPADVPALLALPGIGAYTAGAIASIAFQRREIAIDGNVKRVIARVFGITEPVDAPATAKAIAARVQERQPALRPGDFTQAMMELGAVVCLPSSHPKCEECPLADLCIARRMAAFASIPAKTTKRPRKIEERTIFVLQAADRYFLCKRPHQGLLADLWEFYGTAGCLDPETAKAHVRKLFGPIQTFTSLADRNYVFTHLEWRLRGYAVELIDPNPGIPGQFVNAAELASGFPLPSAFQSYLTDIRKQEATASPSVRPAA
ncbi:MAG: A/G-specific adenine glycosylase [bacterium]